MLRTKRRFLQEFDILGLVDVVFIIVIFGVLTAGATLWLASRGDGGISRSGAMTIRVVDEAGSWTCAVVCPGHGVDSIRNIGRDNLERYSKRIDRAIRNCLSHSFNVNDTVMVQVDSTIPMGVISEIMRLCGAHEDSIPAVRLGQLAGRKQP